ncbi:hypothetical protein L3X38_039233 [Prunus dulcis]|uniref:Uncharacterized protein n=1 Tax=Prunus dulcis TaxID=3755 RepID=A0AAD4V705_PRUDU|nr:hypothetical protein L3X38_039226 [Prunus dulcis]KAI5319525.1 hypothetical protein L3X38_039233 [Prunus dulcis]
MFVFPKPASEPTTNSFTDKRRRKPDTSSTDVADVDELLLSLSIFGFSQLSATDQHEKTKEMYKKVVEDVVVEQLSEESEEDFKLRTFVELFNKLPFPDQKYFLFTVIKKFIRERHIGELISWFTTELDANDQQQLIEEMVHVKADEETDDDFRLRRFTQLCFSIIRFKGQSSYGQWQLIEQLCDGVKGVMVEKLANESDADFKLRIFTELCKKVVDFDVQVHFLDKAVQQLRDKRRDLPHGVLLQPQDYAGAAELLSQLSSFGFSLLTPNDQQDKIEQISNELAVKVVHVERLEGETEEDFRRKTFTKLFNEARVATRVHLFKNLIKKFFHERRLRESFLLFRQLDSNEKQETIEKMLHRLMRRGSKDIKDVILEKLSEECDQHFRLRIFIKLCSTFKYLLDDFIWDEYKKWDLKVLHMQTSGIDIEEIEEIKQSRYAEFYLGLSIIWFKARCASDPRNLIQVLVGKVGGGCDYIIEKFVNETEEDFRLRRFTESLKRLEFSSQEDIVQRIQDTVFHDLGVDIHHQRWPACYSMLPEKPLFAPGFIKLKTPNLRGSGGATATQGGGEGAITQGGQGTSQQ